jgi:hypothetical protein
MSGEQLTFAIAIKVEKIMGAIQGMPWSGPSDVHAKPNSPMVSSGARKSSHQRRTSGLRGMPLRRLPRKWWMDGR